MINPQMQRIYAVSTLIIINFFNGDVSNIANINPVVMFSSIFNKPDSKFLRLICRCKNNKFDF